MLSHSLSLAVSVVKSTIGGILTGSSETLCFFDTFLFQLAWPSDLWRMSATVLNTLRLLSRPALSKDSPRFP